MAEIRPLDLSPEGIKRTAALLNVVYPDAQHITPSYLERLYKGNPLGPTLGLSAFEGGQLVGHYLMLPLVTRIFGVTERGIWPFQLATHPGFQGRGLFSALVERSFDLAREQGFGHLVGVGNANSTPIFVRKWGFQSICTLDVKVGMGRVPEHRVEGDEGLELMRIWDDPAGIAWRLSHPATPYRVRYRSDVGHLYARGPAGIPVEIGAFARSLLPAGLPTLRVGHPVRMWIGADPGRTWTRSAHFDIPARLRPSPLNLLFYDLTDAKRTFDPKRVRYEVFDFDAY